MWQGNVLLFFTGCVDSYVGRTIFNKCVCGLLKDMTVVLVTQQLPYVKVADQVLVMQDVSTLSDGGEFCDTFCLLLMY